MLGLPVLASSAGFQPSSVMFILVWLFMACTGLLLLEVNLWFDEQVSIVTMAEKTLGRWGKSCAWGLFLFLFYSLMVAYVVGSGFLVSTLAQEIGGILISPWIGSVCITVLFGALVYRGTAEVDLFNRFLMLGLIVTYVLMIGLGLPHVQMGLLRHTNWGASTLVIPAMVISFGYHNLIPTLRDYMHSDVKRLRIIILVGSALPLVAYLFWQGVVLGLVPPKAFEGAIEEGQLVTRVLRDSIGSSWVTDLVEYFAFFAIVTSLLTVALSFVDFLADGLHIEKKPKGKVLLCGMVLIPPFLFAMLYPKIFLVALGYAGSFGAVALFGILPAMMVWAGRYRQHRQGSPLLPGGKYTLALVLFFSFAFMALHFAHEFFGLGVL